MDWEELVRSVLDQAMGRYNETFQTIRRVQEEVDQYNGRWLAYAEEQRQTRRQIAQIVARGMDQPVSLPAIRSATVNTPDAVLERRLGEPDKMGQPYKVELGLDPELTLSAIQKAAKMLYERRRNG